MKDNFRYFIIEYPELKLINVWKQTISPTEELERSGLTTATRFTPIITQAPMDGWGGLVKTTYGEDNVHVPTSYLNGVPANQLWHYCIGILCTAPQIYLTEGMPAIYGVSTKRVSLWCALRDSRNYFNFVKHLCICSIYSSLAYQFMAIVICS
ncbi:hypothetical protein TVAG_245820 [Trichomonas vaginalis G3]|uniref:Uncharacterized protein n=1 Tax=Trichomonas vaginalis (strain ATCC PRA-98 / G3) TaxID=412133 RepID=A2E4P0_TRIV3|nr:glycine-rich protein family [Trichomonas vaginalis G3]EAY12350.1 hypothetical protein TVAG_245820 [Trichomonas vaginalis G3]KAI5500768.1 glycine-rich protein family [Trichomonas vaginalis G3]|eukprot:XP_001324573.1 hypothetical protein [Trichomonas vaginalis G3]